MIVGCTAAIVPIQISKGTLSKEIPLCLLAAIVLFVFYLRSLRKTTEKPVICPYTVGIFLITLALVLLIYWWFGWEWFVQMSMAAIAAPFLVPAAMLIAWPARHLKQKIRSR